MPYKKKPKPESKHRLNIDVASKFKQTLINNGYKGLQLNFLMAQAANETEGFSFEKALESNNYGGLKFQTTYKGLARPSGTFNAPRKEDIKKTSYASFKDMDDFVKKWVHLAHLNEMRFENNIGAPLDAKNFEDYERRLALNHYHQQKESIYLKNLKYWDNILEQELPQKNILLLPMPRDRSKDNFRINLPDTREIDKLRIVSPLIDPKKTLIKPVKATDTKNGLMSVSPVFNSEKLIADRPKRIDMINNSFLQRTPIDLNKSDNNKIKNLTEREYDEGFKPPLNYPNIQNKWNDGFLDRPYFFPFTDSPKAGVENGQGRLNSGNFLEIAKMNRPIGGSEKYNLPFAKEGYAFEPPIDIRPEHAGKKNTGQRESSDMNTRDDKARRPVNINLNTPMIGSFTISTKDTTAGLNNLKHQVEEVLLEILNSANAI